MPVEGRVQRKRVLCIYCDGAGFDIDQSYPEADLGLVCRSRLTAASPALRTVARGDTDAELRLAIKGHLRREAGYRRPRWVRRKLDARCAKLGEVWFVRDVGKGESAS